VDRAGLGEECYALRDAAEARPIEEQTKLAGAEAPTSPQIPAAVKAAVQSAANLPVIGPHTAIVRELADKAKANLDKFETMIDQAAKAKAASDAEYHATMPALAERPRRQRRPIHDIPEPNASITASPLTETRRYILACEGDIVAPPLDEQSESVGGKVPFIEFFPIPPPPPPEPLIESAKASPAVDSAERRRLAAERRALSGEESYPFGPINVPDATPPQAPETPDASAPSDAPSARRAPDENLSSATSNPSTIESKE
jgi:hypothetical protein